MKNNILNLISVESELKYIVFGVKPLYFPEYSLIHRKIDTKKTNSDMKSSTQLLSEICYFTENHAHCQINQLFSLKPVVKNTRNPDSMAWVHFINPDTHARKP